MPLFFSYKQVVSLLLLVLFLLSTCKGETDKKLCSIEECRRLGDERIRQGKYSEGIKYYSDAIVQFEAKTNLIENMLIVDYLKILFKRAEVYYLNKQYEFSTKDLDLVIKLFEENKHDEVESHLRALYEQSLKLRGKLGLYLGNFEQSVKDLSSFSDGETMRQRKKAEDALYALENAEESYMKGKYASCVENFGIILQELNAAQENINFRLKRAECALKAKANTNFMAELKRILAKEKNNVAAILLYAQYLYRLGSVDQALGQVRSCLRDDPDNSQCRRVLKEIQNNEKLYGKAKAAWDEKAFGKAAKLFEEYLTNAKDPYNLHETYLRLCQSFKETHDNVKAMNYCNKLIEDLNSDSAESVTHDMVGEAYILRAEMHIAAEDFDAAQQDAQKAQQAGKAQKAQELLSRIDRLKRQASRKNYYKILGVPKNASKQDIKSAFRKHAKTSHPDKVKYKTEEENKRNERKFAEITEAYETLIDDEKRRKYDNGEDENGHQFHQGGHPGFDPFQFFQGGGGPRGHPGAGGQRFEFRFGGGGPGGGFGF